VSALGAQVKIICTVSESRGHVRIEKAKRDPDRFAHTADFPQCRTGKAEVDTSDAIVCPH
jgi:hypothetical protein